MRGRQESMRICAAGMGRVREWVCLLLCFFMASLPTPGQTQEAEDARSAEDAPFDEDGRSAEDAPALSGMTEGRAGECLPVAEDDLIELNFEGADIREVIQGLAAGLCIHYSIDPRVQGAVTLRTASKIRGQDLFPLFHQILRLNGIAAVKTGDIYHIAPVGEAKTKVPLITESSPRRTASAQDEFVIELIKVEHLAATEMTEILQPFVSPGGDVVAYPRGNLVILTDLASNVERLRDLIAAFDTDTFRALHTQIYRIEHANVEDLGKELAHILQPYGVTPENMAERGLYIIPLTRLNAIVVFGFNEEVFSQIEKWIRVLDVPPEKGGGRTVHVYAVENAKAADLASVLGDVYGGGGGGRGRSRRDREGNQDANRNDRDSETGLGRGGGLSGRGSRGDGTRSVLIEPAEGETPLFKEVVRIVADEISNSLIILATPRDYDKIRDVLVRLDVVPRQVLIEAIIAEIKLTGDLKFGIEYAFATGGIEKILGTTGEGSPAGVAAAESGTLDITNSSLLQSGARRAVNIGRNGIFSFITDQARFVSLLNAVSTRSKVNVLATPHVIAADNREAHILIGEEVPILTSTQQSTLATANIVSSIQYRDTGTILTILPQVNSAGLVNMEIRQEVSNVGAPSFGDTNSPSFTSRETETTVVVRNRESVLIGGIIDERVERSRNGVPFLMDVPVLGRLFRVEQDRRERTELVILITPYVIRDRNEAQIVTKEFTRRVNRLREMIERARQPADRKPATERPAQRGASEE